MKIDNDLFNLEATRRLYKGDRRSSTMYSRKTLAERIDDGCFDERWREAVDQLKRTYQELARKKGT